MQKIWYIKLNGTREGPYSVLDLKRDKRITPDTLVWRKGFDKWQKIRYVPELQIVFADDKGDSKEDIEVIRPVGIDDEVVLDMRGGNPNKGLWLAIMVLLFLYLWMWLWY